MRGLIAYFWYERRNRCPRVCNEMHTETGFCLIAQQCRRNRKRNARLKTLRELQEYIERNHLI
jgi:hypothetical protein